jgi:hypothetical protein
MSLRKKDVYSKLSDYGRKILGKSCSSEQTILSGKSCSSEQTILSGKSCSSEHATLSGKSPSDRATLSGKNIILPTPTPPNSPIYKDIEDSKINIIPMIKTIEEPYLTKEIDTITIKPERTSFNLCKIM